MKCDQMRLNEVTISPLFLFRFCGTEKKSIRLLAISAGKQRNVAIGVHDLLVASFVVTVANKTIHNNLSFFFKGD